MQEMMNILQATLIAKLLVAVILGGAIGLEREIADSPRELLLF